MKVMGKFAALAGAAFVARSDTTSGAGRFPAGIRYHSRWERFFLFGRETLCFRKAAG